MLKNKEKSIEEKKVVRKVRTFKAIRVASGVLTLGISEVFFQMGQCSKENEAYVNALNDQDKEIALLKMKVEQLQRELEDYEDEDEEIDYPNSTKADESDKTED